MTIKIEGQINEPLLGGARIANNTPQRFERPKSNDDILIENKNPINEFVSSSVGNRAKLDRIKETPQPSKTTPNQIPDREEAGFTGLSNIGNTCFMNCILQSLANLKELRDYFLTCRFRKDLNYANRLGTGGVLADKYHTTLKRIWSQSSGTYPPYELKAVVSKRASQFSGFMQHDAQEFLAFFLDLLHEDLNRVVDKPLFETPDLSNFPDKAIAEELWKLHKSRNDSYIVDLFHGMLKSRLTCPQCDKRSTTFDPFVFLSVPIPQGKMRIGVTFCGEEIGPATFDVLVSGTETASHLLAAASVKYNVPFESLKLLNITSSYECEEMTKTSSLTYCRYATLIVLQKERMSGDVDTRTVVVLQRQNTSDVCRNCDKTAKEHNVKIMRCTKCKNVGYCSRECQGADWSKHKTTCLPNFVGVPFVVQVPENVSVDSFLHKVNKWLDFSVEISRKSSQDAESLSKVSCIHKEDDFKMYKCCETTKEHPLKKDGALDFGNASRVVLEWGTDFVVCPKATVNSKTSTGLDITDCLRLFTEPEVLAAEEAWHCPQCKESRKATKELSLWKLPEVLIIQLKRFSLQNRLWRRKVDDLVNFPIEGLDLRPFCVNAEDPDPIYDLFAVANHHGALHGGHYTSFVTLSDGSGPGWRFCDDSNVTRVKSLDRLVTKSSYVLFYRRRNADASVKHSDSTDGIPDKVQNVASKPCNNLNGLNPEASDVKVPREDETEVACCSNYINSSPNADSYTDMDVLD